MATPPTNVFTYPSTIGQHIENFRNLILECSGLKPEWIDFIKADTVLHSSLRQAVSGLVTYYTNQSIAKMIPVNPTMILAALKYCKPADVKVIILGHDPGESQFGASGSGVEKVHDALQAAGFTPGTILNHQQSWARRGVLLLNACLTIDPDNKHHFEHWKNFTCRLLQNLLRQNRNDAGPPIFVLCWGTHARDVRNYLGPSLQPEDTVVEYDGDHSELQQQQQLGPVVIASGHHPTFPHGSNGENKFLAQATNQFTAIIRSSPQYSTLFN